WKHLPTIILIGVVLSSLGIFYVTPEIDNASLTVKTTGQQ
ncbi:hypothetical protein DBR06_SOUSAS13510075, partial [Sousa chinensis]